MVSTLLESPLWLSLHSLFVVFSLLTYVLTTHSLQQRRSPSTAIAWVLAIILIPYLGLPLYLFFGTRKLVHATTPAATAIPKARHPTDSWARQLAAAMGQPPVASYHKLRIHADGEQALQSLWHTIESAQTELVVCTFIVGRDVIGKELIERLIRKARTGVRVRLLLDGVGRAMGNWISLRTLKSAGAEVALYGPILHLPIGNYTNMRNHRKLVVSDGERLWCGGRNFAAEYFVGIGKHSAWRDLSFDLEGPLAAEARALFEHDWAYANGAACSRAVTQPPEAVEPYGQVIASGPDQADDTVHDLLITACFKARSRVLAATAYFVPSDELLTALVLAARRGVQVDMVLPGRSNHWLADFARHRALRELAAAGGKIWFTPYMLHAKAVVIDDELALAGSANLDSRSLLLNYEVMLAFYDRTDVRRFAAVIEGHRHAATGYRPRKPGLWRDLSEGLVLWLAFQL
jgi:cardiolipin synthase